MARRGSTADRRHEHPVDELDRQVLEAEAGIARAALQEDMAAGLLPPGATRGLHPHELAARVSFAAIAIGEEAASQGIAQRLIDDRAAFLDLLVADLAAQPSGRAVVDRLLALETAGIVQVGGVGDLVGATATAVQAALLAHADLAAQMAASEAALQGVDIGPALLDVAALAQIEQLSQRLAVGPHVDLVRALRDVAVRLPTPPAAPSLAGDLRLAGQALSQQPLLQSARDAVAQADGMGRQATADVVAPAQIYASELLDRNTCGPCSLIDGTEYPSLSAARVDYPIGNYIRCEGGDRCRGTLVFVWATEAPPTT